MTSRSFIAAVLAGCVLAASGVSADDAPQPIAVPLPPHPTAAVGVVLRDGVGICTGSLIAPDMILTAAHCAEGVDAESDPGRLRFRTGAYPGLTPVELPAARIVLHPLYPRNGEPAGVERRTGYDLALLRLTSPVPPTAAFPLVPSREAVVGPRLLIASYRGGRGERAREHTCPVIDATDRMIRMGCDVRPGESGSPVLQRGAGGLVLVGVLSARAEDGPQKLAIAAGSTRIGQLQALMGPDLRAP
jgi:protease YdgD